MKLDHFNLGQAIGVKANCRRVVWRDLPADDGIESNETLIAKSISKIITQSKIKPVALESYLAKFGRVRCERLSMRHLPAGILSAIDLNDRSLASSDQSTLTDIISGDSVK